MTPALIAAQEQRLARIAALHRKEHESGLSIEEIGLRVMLARLVKLDARLWA